jgi:hypothetical protein
LRKRWQLKKAPEKKKKREIKTASINTDTITTIATGQISIGQGRRTRMRGATFTVTNDRGIREMTTTTRTAPEGIQKHRILRKIYHHPLKTYHLPRSRVRSVILG